MKATKSNKLILFFAALAMCLTLFVPAVKVKAAGTPMNVTQTGVGTNAIKVEWTAPTDATTATTYIVYYSKNKDYGYTAYGSSTAACSMEIYNLEAGTLYYIQVARLEGSTEMSRSEAITAVTVPSSTGMTVTQTSAGTTTANIKWTECAGASGYLLYVDSNETPQNIVGNNCTVTGLSVDAKHTVSVYPYKADPTTGKIATVSDGYASSYVYTMANKVTGLDLYSWNPNTNKALVTWNNDIVYEDGFEIEISSLAGKKLKTYTVSGSVFASKISKEFKLAKVKGKGFIFRVREYSTFDGKKSYSAWSSKKTIVAMPKMTPVKKTHKIKWSKVSGAQSYTIYRSNTLNGKYKKYKTVNSKTTSYNFGNYKGYVYVVANKVKVGKKRVNSTVPASGTVIHLY